jgi:hypothetical protein
MRLPTNGSSKDIDEAEATRMLHHAIEQGVNYVDTAYGYHDGASEVFLGRALQNGYRTRVKVATKLPCWEVNEPADFDRLLNEQMSRLQTDYIDCYLLHSLNKENWDKVRDMGVLEWLEQARAEGRVHHVGFSFHDQYPVFQEIVDAHDGWDFCQIQYNYANEDVQAGTRGLEYAAARGLGVVIMEPLLGGKLVNPPDAVQSLWDRATTRRGAAEWALQWLWNRPEVSTVLSGMSTLEQVSENVASAARSAVGVLSPAEIELVGQVRDRYAEICPVPCTGCRYCMPCPHGINIPENFVIVNDGVMYNRMEESRERYAGMPEGDRALACVQCRECEPKCPQSIRISQWMPFIDDVLGHGMSYSEDACRQFQ